jgi:hypothetical protein
METDMVVQINPDRDFVGGYPKVPATYTAYSEDGRYFTAFVSEYSCQADFERDAVEFFNRKTV